MPIIPVPGDGPESSHYERLVPGSRVEYRGTSWKVVGICYSDAPYSGTQRRGSGRDANGASTTAAARTKYLILRSLGLAPEVLYSLG